MKYEEFRDEIEKILQENPKGLTWSQIKERLNLPQKVPNNQWVAKLEKEINLVREKQEKSVLIWRI